MSKQEKDGFLLNISLPINLNDPGNVESCLMQVAHKMIENDHEPIRMVGIFMKAQAGALAASLADLKRQFGDDNKLGASDCIQAALNCWAQFVAIMITQATTTNDNANGAANEAANVFGTLVTQMVRHNNDPDSGVADRYEEVNCNRTVH